MFKGRINPEVNDLVINSDGKIANSRSVHHVSGTTNEGKPFDATFRITDVYRQRRGKWVMVQEHMSVPPHSPPGGEHQIRVRRAKWALGLRSAASSRSLK